MTTRFPCLNLQGGLIAADLVDRIAEGSAPGQKTVDFGLDGRRHLTDEIAAAWTDARAYWTAFQHRLERISPDDTATSVTRDQWMIPLLSLLDYELTYTPKAAEADGQTYALSHRAGTGDDAVPIHIVGSRQSLDRRPPSGRPRLGPHSLLQEYLNRTEHLWGLVTNGLILRILRNSQLMRRQAYIEFDIIQMMEGEKFAEFSLLYRLVHRTRLPQEDEEAAQCLLEQYHRLTLEQGGRVRDHLRDGVEQSLRILANGLVKNARNQRLREAISEGRLKPLDLYQQLLRMIYRFLFLMVAEERNLITENPVYREHYSITKLRRLAETRSAYSEQEDLWLGLRTTFRLFQDEKTGEMLGTPPLNGDLFDATRTRDLENLKLENRELLRAVWHLSMYRENERTPWRRINYGALDVEELGSVYESLLDFTPLFREQNGIPTFELGYGTERKSTGSYYTPPELVNELIKSALIPVMEDKLKAAKTNWEKKKAILGLKVCDPAAGSGHFLLAAARRLGRELAKIRTGDDEPAPEEMRLAIRDCITHCIYGVDKNPLAVDLCKVALWIEGHAKGKPLTFLDHRIRCGDSLIGVMDLKVLKEGIPDEAFKPVVGDDKEVARAIKKHNREERKGQWKIPFTTETELRNLTDDRRLLMELPDDTPEQIRQKVEVYQRCQSEGTKWWEGNTTCHLWTAAFFVELTEENARNCRIPTTDTLNRYLETKSIDGRYIGTAWALAQRHRFFHWPLEYPEVFTKISSKGFPPLAGGTDGGGSNGFDCVLGNPPWERIKLQEKEFFAQKDPEIATAPNAAARKRLIAQLPETNPGLWLDFLESKHISECESHFMRASGRYPLSAVGDINTYQIFAGLARELISEIGRAGIVIPSGIATDDSNKQFFADLTEKQALISLYDFENRDGIFPAVHRSYKFCLLSIGGTGAALKGTDFAFFLTNVGQMKDKDRRFSLSTEDIALLNPNTHTCPIFRTKRDAALTKSIYLAAPAFQIDGVNRWSMKLGTLFHSSNDAHRFEEFDNLISLGWQLGLNGLLQLGEDLAYPLYEGKMFTLYDHRAATVILSGAATFRQRQSRETTTDEHRDPHFKALPFFWVRSENLETNTLWQWILCFKKVTSPTNERTLIATVLPRCAANDSVHLLFPQSSPNARDLACFLAAMASYPVDYVGRQKLGGVNFNFFVFEQLPFHHPSVFVEACEWSTSESHNNWINHRVVELVYTSWDMKPFAEDCGYEGTPFIWNEERRFLIRSELDAAFFHLYGIARDDVAYIMETFPIVKRKDEQKYGEYHTKRVILECYDAMAKAMETGQPYQTILDPPPADPRVAHQPDKR